MFRLWLRIPLGSWLLKNSIFLCCLCDGQFFRPRIFSNVLQWILVQFGQGSRISEVILYQDKRNTLRTPLRNQWIKMWHGIVNTTKMETETTRYCSVNNWFCCYMFRPFFRLSSGIHETNSDKFLSTLNALIWIHIYINWFYNSQSLIQIFYGTIHAPILFDIYVLIYVNSNS
jgi:hypothetical protein